MKLLPKTLFAYWARTARSTGGTCASSAEGGPSSSSTPFSCSSSRNCGASVGSASGPVGCRRETGSSARPGATSTST